MAEVVEKTGVTKEKGYLYYLDKQGDVSRSKMARAGKGGGNAEKVATAGVTRESGYLYFIDKNGDEYTLTVSEAFTTVDDRKLMQYMLSSKTEDESGKSVNIIEKSSRGDFDKSQNEDDLRHENILIDKTSADLLKGSEVDFVKELIGDSFKINNPQSKSSCGCGVSFSL